MAWFTIKDTAVRHIWKGDNDEIAVISPDWYENNGTPIDPETGEDMKYSHTEIELISEKEN